jgi:CRP-like cAMP-binding protein
MTSHLAQINDFLARLDGEAKASLDRVMMRRAFGRGEYLLRPDEICRRSFLIVEGIARKFYITEAGKEITTKFYFENDLAISFQSYTLQKPGSEFIQALENVVVTVTDYEAFQNLKKDFPQLLELDLMMVEYYAMWLEERLLQFHSLDAAGRYRRLLKDYPQFVQKVQLTHIASYLGISLETLSRIRAKI